MNKKIKDKIVFSFVEKDNGRIEMKLVVNGQWNSPVQVILPFSEDNPHRVIQWLEEIVIQKDSKPVELLMGRFVYDERDTILSYSPISEKLSPYDNNLSRRESRYGVFSVYKCWCDKQACEVVCDTDIFALQFYSKIKHDMKGNDTFRSQVIESYLLHMPPVRLDYSGYFAVMEVSEYDFRFNGLIYDMESPDAALDGYAFYTDDTDDAQQLFECLVNGIISLKKWKQKNAQWEESDVDRESVGCVFDIMPERFKERVASGLFDRRLLTEVPGGDYCVPLYYVTIAWDVLLKGSLGDYAYKIGPEEDEYVDDYETALKEFMADGATRTRQEACRDNDEMKSIWKDVFGLDLYKVEVDFTQYDMHIPPNVSEECYYEYFLEVPNGLSEWIFDGINYPDGKCSFDSVSALMEFTALIVKERQDEWRSYCDNQS